MILTTAQADPLIVEAMRTGELVSDDVARTIASWYHSPAPADEQIVRLSPGQDFDARALVNRLSEMIDRVERGDREDRPTLVELHALGAWALARVPHVVIETVEMDADTWEKWTSGEIERTDDDRPDGVTGSVEERVIDDYADDTGDWSYPGDANYPAEPEKCEPYDAEDGGAWVPGTLIETTVALLTGKFAHFWGIANADPFDWGLYWEHADPHDTGVGVRYASRYNHPYTGAVEIKIARLVGFSDADETAVYQEMTKPRTS